MNVRQVLVFPAGTEIGLEIHQALVHCKEVRLFGAGIAGTNHGQFAYERYLTLPSIYENGWLDALIEVCHTWKIDYLFPAFDDVIVELAKVRDRIPAVVLAPSLRTCLVTRSKQQTYAALQGVIRVPRVYTAPPAAADYPVLVKPDQGQGSKDIRRVDTLEALTLACQATDQPIICEYLPGEEYTVDCFSDRERGVLFAGARIRQRTRNGISVNTVSCPLPGIDAMAQAIHATFDMQGVWFFQLKRAADGELALLEVAPRIAGSMSLHRVMGVNFPLLTIFEHERLALTLQVNNHAVELDRALCNRYKHAIVFESAYIDLDDTVIRGDQVNIDAIRFIHQCKNRLKPVILITRHAGDLIATLKRFGLTDLFDEVIHLQAGEKKSAYITRPHSIFIDDSFAERKDVHQKHGIPTFDVSMIELFSDQASSL